MPNQNNDRPDQVVARHVRDLIPSFKEMMFESGKQQDSIAVWLVGMSTGSIALIISQFGKFDPALYSALKVSVFFLTGTIIFGLVFRIAHLFLQDRERHDLMFIMGWLSGHSERSTEALLELPEDSSAEFIASCLYNLMEIDMTPELRADIRTKNDVEYWRNEYEETAELYRRLKESEHEMKKDMIEDFDALIANLEGLPPRKYEQIVKRDESKGIRKRRLQKFCRCAYILMCTSFAVSVLFISCSFIKTDLKVNHSSSTTNQKVVSPAKQVQPNLPD